MSQEEILLAKMTWPEVEERLKQINIAIVPVGSTEQHGPAIPVDNDAFTAYTLARMAVERMSSPKPIITPPISFGMSMHHMGFPGTITLRAETLVEVVVDVCRSLVHHGFKKIVLMNGHGGNIPALEVAMYRTRNETGALVFLINWWELVGDVIKQLTEPPLFHADETETSVAMAIGQRVRREHLVREIPTTPIPEFLKVDLYAPPPVAHTPIDMKALTKSGVIGDATRASEEKGRKIVEAVLERTVKFLEELRNL